jgi:hypothetical protein
VPTTGGSAATPPEHEGTPTAVGPAPTTGRPASPVRPPAASTDPSADPFQETDEGLQRTVEEHAVWQAPAALQVNRSGRIGLVIGDSDRLRTQIDALVEKAVPRPAGPVRVGPKVRVALWADSGDAQVKPSEAVDQSTGSQVAMLWTWFVRPLHPSDGMVFIAHIALPSDGHTFTTDIPLTLPVERTASHTLSQLSTHWATWSAIVVAIASGVRWLWKRRRGKRADADGPDDNAPASGQLPSPV